MYTYIYICVCVYIQMSVCIYTCKVCVCISLSLCIYIYIYDYRGSTVLTQSWLARRSARMLESILFTLLDSCVSSLRRGHASLLCIVPILADDPRRESTCLRTYGFCSDDDSIVCSCQPSLSQRSESPPGFAQSPY